MSFEGNLNWWLDCVEKHCKENLNLTSVFVSSMHFFMYRQYILCTVKPRLQCFQGFCSYCNDCDIQKSILCDNYIKVINSGSRWLYATWISQCRYSCFDKQWYRHQLLIWNVFRKKFYIPFSSLFSIHKMYLNDVHFSVT